MPLPQRWGLDMAQLQNTSRSSENSEECHLARRSSAPRTSSPSHFSSYQNIRKSIRSLRIFTDSRRTLFMARPSKRFAAECAPRFARKLCATCVKETRDATRLDETKTFAVEGNCRRCGRRPRGIVGDGPHVQAWQQSF